tara:strand:- start:119 stop:1144 length:1026 start_codon:yes stop_codon:yes gene_type:complete
MEKVIAIHHRLGSFSDRWIQYCKEKNIKFKLVNCYENNIISQIQNCSGLMWHWDQNDYRSNLFAKQLMVSIKKMGIKVYPNIYTSWHFDDKIGQKYLLEAINAPLVNTYIFYDKKEAQKWIKSVEFPKVFKLSGGAGSVNVQLVNNKQRALRLVNQAFGNGFSSINKKNRLFDRIRKFNQQKNFSNFKKIVGGFGRLFIPTEIEKFSPNDKGYIYFQDYIPNNEYDTRMIVIGSRCFAVRRYCRKNDFRASGSGIAAYDKDLFDIRMVKVSFEVSKKINSQSMAFDFVIHEGKPKIIEISYCFIIGEFYDQCHGYWDEDLIWHNEEVNPQRFIIEDFIKNI